MSKNNDSRRTLQKVRRDSKPVGSFESGFWRPTDAREMRAALKAAERFDLARKHKGRRSGPLGYTGLLVYRALWRFVRFRDGCLCPSYDRLQKATGLCRAAVAGALKRLRAAGFLTWQRRLEYTGEAGAVRGREVRQVAVDLSVSERTVRRAIDRGELPVVRLGPRIVRVPAAAVELIGRVILPLDALDRMRARSAFVLECERQARAIAFEASGLKRAFDRLEAVLFPTPSLQSARNPPSEVS